MTDRKNISNVSRNDLLLRFAFEDEGGFSNYHIFTLADHVVTSRPIGTLILKPGNYPVTIKWAKHVRSTASLVAPLPDAATDS